MRTIFRAMNQSSGKRAPLLNRFLFEFRVNVYVRMRACVSVQRHTCRQSWNFKPYSYIYGQNKMSRIGIVIFQDWTPEALRKFINMPSEEQNHCQKLKSWEWQFWQVFLHCNVALWPLPSTFNATAFEGPQQTQTTECRIPSHINPFYI